MKESTSKHSCFEVLHVLRIVIGRITIAVAGLLAHVHQREGRADHIGATMVQQPQGGLYGLLRRTPPTRQKNRRIRFPRQHPRVRHREDWRSIEDHKIKSTSKIREQRIHRRPAEHVAGRLRSIRDNEKGRARLGVVIEGVVETRLALENLYQPEGGLFVKMLDDGASAQITVYHHALGSLDRRGQPKTYGGCCLAFSAERGGHGDDARRLALAARQKARA